MPLKNIYAYRDIQEAMANDTTDQLTGEAKSIGISLSVIIQEVKMESLYGAGSEFMDRHQALTHPLTRCSQMEEF